MCGKEAPPGASDSIKEGAAGYFEKGSMTPEKLEKAISGILIWPFAFFGFSGGFTLSTSAVTSLNGKGICGIGFADIERLLEGRKSGIHVLSFE
jgi:hypothetical protein